MATKVFMEALSPTMEEGRLVKWMKAEGDAVKSGDVLAEVETDKAIMELVARGDGVLRKRLIEEGATSPVGVVIAVIAGADEDISALVAGAPTAAAPAAAAPTAAPSAAPQAPPPPRPTPQAPGPRPQAPGPTPPAPGPAPQAAAPPQQQAPAPSTQHSAAVARQRSSPLARRLAAERGLDLATVGGSGPGGRIIKRDVEAAPGVTAAPKTDGAAARAASGEDYRDVPLTQIRKTIARRLAESIGPVPTFYLTAEFDLERAAEMRTAMAELGDEYKVSFNDIIMKAVATALAQHPECNAHWLGDHIRYFNRVHIGMAVAVEDGLITPVIFDADQKGLREIALESRELAGRARERRLKPDEYTGSTFSVSNLGMFGIDHFTAIINPPEAGILAIGGIEQRPVVVEGNVVVRRKLRVTMSCDHRVIDGASGAKFLQTLRRLLELPLLLAY
jgi:pyruvate dehydrogenase E2 component (dihydrolipoamide acetyltransferase)